MTIWLDKLMCEVKDIKSKVNTFETFTKELKKREYIVSYPEVLRRVYWDGENE